MVNGFKSHTHDLTKWEQRLALEIGRGLWSVVGRGNAVTSRQIIEEVASRYPQAQTLTGARVRAIIRFLRLTGKITDLVGNEKGYYRERTTEALMRYKESLRQRATAILETEAAIKPMI